MKGYKTFFIITELNKLECLPMSSLQENVLVSNCKCQTSLINSERANTPAYFASASMMKYIKNFFVVTDGGVK